MATPEKLVENKIKAQLDKIGAYYHKNFGSSYSGKGIPDIEGVYAGKFFAIEVKRVTGGAPTPTQIRHLIDIARNGGIAMISSDPKCVDCLLTENVELVDYQYFRDKNVTVEQAKDLWQKRKKGSIAVQLV